MKTTEKLLIAISVLAIIALGSCQSEAGKKAEMERIKAERAYDSIKKVGDAKIKYYSCQEELMLVGASKDTAECKCKELYYEGFYYDSIDVVLKNDTIKTK